MNDNIPVSHKRYFFLAVVAVYALLFSLLAMGCGDTLVDPTPVTVEGDTTTVIVEDFHRDMTKYHGRWVGTWRDDDVTRWDIRFKIGPLDDSGRIVIGGEIKLTDKTRDFTQSYPVQGVHAIADEHSLQATIYVTGVWDVWCRVVKDDADTMECSVSHVRPFGTIYFLTKENDVFPKN